MTTKKAVWVLNRIQGFGVQTFRRLRDELGDVAKLSDPASLDQLRAKPEWGAGFVNRYLELEAAGDFEREMDRCAKDGIEILSILDSDYPKNLASVYDPPLVLYVKGTLIPEDKLALAIVGSRNPSLYGLRIAARFSSELAERGFTVVSGFARGIDSEAHRGALRVKGRTIAVLGCGLDVLYPKEHGQLYEEIAAQGALMSELPLGTPPQSFHFPRRNRLISGLVAGVLVVEASRRSGSLITARLAAEEGREVYAVPGLIDSPTSAGTNQLIQEGAKLVTGVSDILEDLAPQLRALLCSLNRHCEEARRADEAIPDSEIAPQGLSRSYGKKSTDGIASASSGPPPRPPEDGSVQRPVADNDDSHDPVLKLLANQPLSLDEITIGLNEDPARIRSRLTQLELNGTVKRMFGGRYVRRP